MAALRSLDVELEAVTPLWIGGANARAELRPPSVRGCMRFWFRALAGGLLGETLRDVWEAESAVFGNTTRASSVVVRLFGSPQTSVSVAGETEQLPGLSYMFWSVFQQKRDAILPGERFRLRLHSRPFPFAAVEVAGRTLEMADSFELAAASLWLLLRLGGVGARVRRGGGGMRAVVEPEGWPNGLPALVSGATTPAELAAELSEGIRRVRQAAGWQARPLADPSSYDILHERVCELYLADITFPSWWEAVNWAGETVPGLPDRIQAGCLRGGRPVDAGPADRTHDPAGGPGVADRVLFQIDLRRPDRPGRRSQGGPPQGLGERDARPGAGTRIPLVLPRRPVGRHSGHLRRAHGIVPLPVCCRIMR